MKTALRMDGHAGGIQNLCRLGLLKLSNSISPTNGFRTSVGHENARSRVGFERLV